MAVAVPIPAGEAPARPPRDDLFRAIAPGAEMREQIDGGDETPTMRGHFAVFNEWTEIDSILEGHFMERIAPGAAAKTIRENRDRMRCIFRHGRDPQLGDKPLGTIRELGEDDRGIYYEVPLLDAPYVRENVLPGLRAGLYGSSFNFKVVRDDFDQRPKRTDLNPEGLPERTITEMRIYEFGPCTFPAYEGASAAIRSLTDEITAERLEAAGFVHRAGISLAGVEVPAEERDTEPEPEPEPEPEETADESATIENSTTKEPEPSEVTTPVAEPEPPGATTPQPTENATKEKVTMGHSIPEHEATLSDVRAQMNALDEEYRDQQFPEEARTRYDELKQEKAALISLIAELKERTAEVAERAGNERNTERAVPYTNAGMTRGEDIYDLSTVRDSYSNPEGARSELISRAMRSVEGGRFPHPNVKREQAQDHIDGLFSRVKSGEGQDAQEQLALHLLRTGSPVYSRAFGKALAQAPLSNEERTALAIGGSGAQGNFAIPYQLDPTVIPVSNGSVNPIRQIARVESIVGANEWRGVTSTGMTASYAAEADEVDDDAPVLVQPAIIVERADAFVPFSFEVGQDWTAMQSELARMTQDAKDDLESTKFLSGAGHGSTEPQGLLVGATTTVTTAAVQTFAVADLYSLHEALPERFEPMGRFLASRAIYNDIRQFDTGGGANLWVMLGDGNPPQLIGYPAHHTSGMATSPVGDNEKLMVFGDFRHYVIVDRIGMQVEIVPHLFAVAANRPSGERGFLAWWRNSAEVVAVNAFRVLVANDT